VDFFDGLQLCAAWSLWQKFVLQRGRSVWVVMQIVQIVLLGASLNRDTVLILTELANSSIVMEAKLRAHSSSAVSCESVRETSFWFAMMRWLLQRMLMVELPLRHVTRDTPSKAVRGFNQKRDDLLTSHLHQLNCSLFIAFDWLLKTQRSLGHPIAIAPTGGLRCISVSPLPGRSCYASNLALRPYFRELRIYNFCLR
jgi:hypothetical protein